MADEQPIYGMWRVAVMTTKRSLAQTRPLATTALALILAAGTGAAVAQGISVRAPDQRNHDEADMLARARAEHARRDVASPDANGEPASDPGDMVRAQAIESEVAKRMREAERDAELERVSANIRRASASRALPNAAPTPSAIDAIEPITSQPEPRQEAIAPFASGAERATVLLVMNPGFTGIRLFNNTADPILCMPDVCWISRGPDEDARMVPRRKALGPLNTLGNRAGACNDRTGCVFRNVEITPAASVVQPIDMRLLRHDRREAIQVRVDRSCRMEGNQLQCAAPQRGPDYQVWVVPEVLAGDAGGRALAKVVDVRPRAFTAARMR